MTSLDFLDQLEDGHRAIYQLGYITDGAIMHQDLLDWALRSVVEGGSQGNSLASSRPSNKAPSKPHSLPDYAHQRSLGPSCHAANPFCHIYSTFSLLVFPHTVCCIDAICSLSIASQFLLAPVPNTSHLRNHKPPQACFVWPAFQSTPLLPASVILQALPTVWYR